MDDKDKVYYYPESLKRLRAVGATFWRTEKPP